MIFDKLDSTNRFATEMINDIHKPTWILALNQVAGFGRQGRLWIHKKGNFAATLILFPNQEDMYLMRSFVASLALYETFVNLIRNKSIISLKWPNDVLINGKKVSFTGSYFFCP